VLIEGVKRSWGRHSDVARCPSDAFQDQDHETSMVDTLAIAGVLALLAGPAIAQTTGSGTRAPKSGSGTSPPGATTSRQPAPSPPQPSWPSPSVGTAPGTAMPGMARSGSAQLGTGQMGSGSESTRLKRCRRTSPPWRERSLVSPHRWPLFAIGVLVCPCCAGPRRILGAVTEPHARLPPPPGRHRPCRSAPERATLRPLWRRARWAELGPGDGAGNMLWTAQPPS
jgi:hypothetical protein